MIGIMLFVCKSPTAHAQLGDADCDLAGCSCGNCDEADERNLWNPSAANPMTIKTRLIVFAEDDGSFQAISETRMLEQIEQLNLDFEDYGIQFDVEPVVENSTCYRYMCINSEENCASPQLRYDDDSPPALCCDSYHPQAGCDLEDY